MCRRFFSILVFIFLTLGTVDSYALESGLGCSIAQVQGNKVYLKPGSIQIANNGIFINIQGQLQAIDHLEMDEQGVFFDISRSAANESRCRVCGFPLVFGFCLNPACCP